MEIKTNKDKVFVLGNKKTDHAKEVRQSIDLKPGESIRYVSGGRALKSSNFTYLAFHVDSYDENNLQEEIEGEYHSQADANGKANFMVLGANQGTGKSTLVNMLIGKQCSKGKTSAVEKRQCSDYNLYETPSFEESPLSVAKTMELFFKSFKNGISGIMFCQDSQKINSDFITLFLLQCFDKFVTFNGNNLGYGSLFLL